MAAGQFKEAVAHYRNNSGTAMAFALLLVFVLPFILMPKISIGSGTAALDYSLSAAEMPVVLASAAVALLFLLFYSILVTLIIFAVRKDMAKVRLQYYLSEKVQKFSLKIFVFYAILFAVLFAVNALALIFGIHPAASAAFSFVLLAVLLFVPQSIVIDELSISSAVSANLDFIRTNPADLGRALFAGIAFVVAAAAAEYVLDYFLFIGYLVTPALVLILAVPYIECLKSSAYMKKYELIRVKQE
jgi:hypothetical protein